MFPQVPPLVLGRNARRRAGSSRHRPARSGFTLLELMLSLSLSVVVLLLVNMAVDIHLRSLSSRRTQLEESQLARSILRMIANDLRGAVQHYEQDMSAVENLLSQSVASAAGSLGQAAGAALQAGGAGASSGGSGDTPGGAAGSASPTNPSSGSQSGSGGSPPASAGGSSGASATTGSGTGGSSGQPSQNTADLSTATIPPVPGLFGNQYQLQIDVSRLPRIENYQRYLTPDAATAVVDIPSDVKTVTYYVKSVATDGAAADSSAVQPLADLSDPDANPTGLVRRELDRSVTLWAMTNGNFTGLENSGDVIAPEVAAIEFQYFDGTQWLLEWDTETQQTLPIAVLVIVALRAPGTVAAPDVVLSEIPPDANSDLHLYRTVVFLPTGGQSLANDPAASSEATAPTDDASSSNSQSAGSGAAAQGGAGGGQGGGGRGQGGGRDGGGQGGGGRDGGGQGGGGQGGGQRDGGAQGGGGQGGGGQGGGGARGGGGQGGRGGGGQRGGR